MLKQIRLRLLVNDIQRFPEHFYIKSTWISLTKRGGKTMFYLCDIGNRRPCTFSNKFSVISFLWSTIFSYNSTLNTNIGHGLHTSKLTYLYLKQKKLKSKLKNVWYWFMLHTQQLFKSLSWCSCLFNILGLIWTASKQAHLLLTYLFAPTTQFVITI